MTGTIILILIVILATAHFYLKCSVMTAFSLLMSSVIGVIAAFNFYEILGGLFISLGVMPGWMYGLSFLLLFAVGMAVPYVLSTFLAGVAIDFGKGPKAVITTICGVLTGYITAGCFIIFLTLLPISTKIPYSRFGGENISLNNTSSVLLKPDGFVAGMFSMFSKNSLRTDKSFAVFNADFIDRIHLLRAKVKSDNVFPFAGKEAIAVPRKGGVKKTEDGKYAIELGVSAKEIKEGGAASEDGTVSFIVGQTRLLCVPSNQSDVSVGEAEAVYPTAYIERGSMTETQPDKVINFTREHFETKQPLGRSAWIPLVFNVPSGMKPAWIQFKNVSYEVPKPSSAQDEMDSEAVQG